MSGEEQIRVLVAKMGLDGHDRGLRVVAHALREDGIEVIYGGLHLTPEQVARTAADEDVDVIGISILSGAHLVLFPRLFAALAALDAENIGVICGGVIPDLDVPELEEMGVAMVVGQETPLPDVIAAVRSAAAVVRMGLQGSEIL